MKPLTAAQRRASFRPPPSPVPVTLELPRPSTAARPSGWTAARVALATPQGDTITADAYVSPDGRTVVHKPTEYQHLTEKERSRHVTVAVMVAGRAWATIRSTTGARAARALAVRAAAVNEAHAETIASLDTMTPGSRAWLRATETIASAYRAADLT
jgi:hypothetical protein